MRARPSLEVYRENRRSRNKVPYVEFGINDVVVISDEDEDEIKMYDMVRGVPEGPLSVKKETMTVAELDEKLAKRMNDEISQRISQNNQEHAMKMEAIQFELERQRRESQEMHAQLMGFFAQMSAKPPMVYAPPPSTSNMPPFVVPPPPVQFQYPPAPAIDTVPVGSTQLSIPTVIPAVSEVDELRTRVRNSAGHSTIPLRGSVSEDESTSFTVLKRDLDRSGYDTAIHTERVEESQESPTPSQQPFQTEGARAEVKLGRTTSAPRRPSPSPEIWTPTWRSCPSLRTRVRKSTRAATRRAMAAPRLHMLR
jgi:hypothetical protein